MLCLPADGCVAVQQNGRRGSVQHQPGPSACHLALARRSLGNDRERMASVGRSWEVITDWNPCRNNTSGSMSQNVEDYTLIPASIPDLYPSEQHFSLETENPWLHPALSDPDVLCWEAQRKFICNLGSGKGEKGSSADTPRQSVGRISHGSTILSVLSDAILAHVLLPSTPSLLTHSS